MTTATKEQAINQEVRRDLFALTAAALQGVMGRHDLLSRDEDDQEGIAERCARLAVVAAYRAWGEVEAHLNCRLNPGTDYCNPRENPPRAPADY